MIRKSLAKIPVEKGDRLSAILSIVLLGWIMGWASHEWSVPPGWCWFPV